MKKSEKITSVRFSGHGHYKVTISYYGKNYTATINDMTLIDDYKDGINQDALYDAVKHFAV